MSENKFSAGSFLKGLFTGVAAALAGVALFAGNMIADTKDEAVSLDSVSKLARLSTFIENNYYKPVDAEALREGMYKGLFKGIGDKYSVYYTKEEAAAANEELTGTYVGIGVVVSQNKETTVKTITTVYEGSPAKEAGLLKGDIITGVDGTDVRAMSLTGTVKMMRGESGTTVEMTVERDGSEKTFTVTRRRVYTPTIYATLFDNGVGYVRISEFNTGTADDFRKNMEKLKEDGMTSVIYDLRSNPGGLVSEVTNMLDQILPKGTVVYTLDSKGRRSDYTSDEESKIELPAAVLVNEDTASSAEIFTAAMKDYDAAAIIGEKTYGKGIVQISHPQADGSVFELTEMEYFSPKGNAIHGKGVEPDIEVEYDFSGDEEEISNKETEDLTLEDYLCDSQFKKAYEILTGK